MTLPRPVEPGSFYLITRRCTQRQFLLRPDDETKNAYVYCLADAARRTKMEVVTTFCNTNHHHTVIYDRAGNHPVFVEHFHKMLARCMNVYRGRTECFWSSHPVTVTKLVDTASVVAEIVYTITNGVKDQLVEKVHHWPGVNGYEYLRKDKPMTATRPRFFFGTESKMPKQVSLSFVVPPELEMTREQLLDVLKQRIPEVEEEARAHRAATGGHILGRAAVRKAPWTNQPTSSEAPRTLRPRFACRDKATRIDALIRYRTFLRAYRDARKKLLEQKPAHFPLGTYWLRHFAAVLIAAP